MRDRIDLCNQYLAGLREADVAGTPLPVALFGYSAGGLIRRGILRAYPQTPISAIFQFAAPNAGIVADDPKTLLRRIHFDRDVLEDLQVDSPFMAWLNDTPGHWDFNVKRRRERWRLDKKP